MSCTATDCAAVGTEGSGSLTLAEVWNGTSWAIESTPNPAGLSGLNGVSCTADICTAVGQGNLDAAENAGNGFAVPLAEGWNGASWTIQSTPTPAGPSNRSLSGVACTTATACTAVGSHTNYSNTLVTLAETWNGTSWAVQTTPNESGVARSDLSGVSCPTTGECAAAGYYASPAGGNPPPDFALAEGLDGTNWSIQGTPSPGAGYNSVLPSVSCTATTACMAVGYDYYNQGANDAVLAEQWNGTAWAIQAPPNPTGADSSALDGVSCATATSCVAVGGSGFSALAEQWNGTAWTIESPPNPALSGNTVLAAVSCTTATSCTAVGNYLDTSTGTPMTLAEQWNGSAWAIQATPNPSVGGVLSSVSCTTATACIAVGQTDASPPESNGSTLAEQWNGSAWTIQTTPNPPGGGSLLSVSCTTATACTAVGQSDGTTLVERYTG